MQIIVLCILFFIVLPTIILTVYVINLWKRKIHPKLQNVFQKESEAQVYECVEEYTRNKK